MTIPAEDLVKILLAIFVGGAIGFEREFRDKAAGFRTLIFICLGSTLFTIFSVKLAGFGDARFGGPGDATRIASNIVAGVGFLGAGVILRAGGRVFGITTAAAVWLVAALGMGIGAAEYSLVLTVTALSLVVLWLFPFFERWIDRIREERQYEIVYAVASNKGPVLDEAFRAHGLRVAQQEHTRAGDRITCSCKVAGPLANHQRLVAQLLGDPEFERVRY